MTSAEYAKQLRDGINQLLTENKPLELASRTVLAQLGERIFTDGRNSADSNIGQYDTKTPLYINPKKTTAGTKKKGYSLQGLEPPTGKHGDTKFKDGKPHKTTYVNNYKDFRNRIGRRIDRVNLELTGDLFLDLLNPKSEDSAGSSRPVKISINEYQVQLKRNVNTRKREHLEKKYGTIFNHTPAEVDEFYRIAELELRELLEP